LYGQTLTHLLFANAARVYYTTAKSDRLLLPSMIQVSMQLSVQGLYLPDSQEMEKAMAGATLNSASLGEISPIHIAPD
jgi:hypothetical protein